MPLLDTRKSRDLTGTLISDIVLQLLSYVAQLEREFIHQRQAEGIAAAKAQGVRFGREPLPVPAEFPEVLDCWKHGKIGSPPAPSGGTARRFADDVPEVVQRVGMRDKIGHIAKLGR